MKHKTYSLLALAVLLSCSSVEAAITITANNNGSARVITTAEGVAFATGTGSVRVGYFLDPTAAQLKTGDWNYIKNNFIPLGEGVGSLGDVTTPAVAGNLPIPVPSGGTAGKFSGQITGVTGTNLAVNPTVPSATILNQGTRVFVLASNSADPANIAPTQFALVSDALLWIAPKDDPLIPGGASLTMALNTTNLDTASSANELFWGTYDTVVSGTTTNFLRAAAAVPEPTISALFLLGAAVGFRRRR